MDFLLFAFVVGMLFVAVSCLSDWVLSGLDPYSRAPEAGHPREQNRLASRLLVVPARKQRRLSNTRGLKRHDVQLRDLPFIC